MGWKAFAILPLIFLGGGAAPPDDCMQAPGAGQTLPQTLPAPLDLAGRPAASGGLSSQSLAPMPAQAGMAGCRGPLAPASGTDSLRQESDDVLHGLPSSETLRRIDEPRRAPVFQ